MSWKSVINQESYECPKVVPGPLLAIWGLSNYVIRRRPSKIYEIIAYRGPPLFYLI